MIPAPPPPPPPPPPPQSSRSLNVTTASNTSSSVTGKNKKLHPLVGGAEPELHGALMAELREFAKAPRKRDSSKPRRPRESELPSKTEKLYNMYGKKQDQDITSNDESKSLENKKETETSKAVNTSDDSGKIDIKKTDLISEDSIEVKNTESKGKSEEKVNIHSIEIKKSEDIVNSIAINSITNEERPIEIKLVQERKMESSVKKDKKVDKIHR